MGKTNKAKPEPLKTVTEISKEDSINNLQTQLSNLSREYNNVIAKAQQFRESSLKNALAINLLIRTVTSRLLEIESTDEVVRGQINSLLKEINITSKPEENAKQD